MASKYLIDAVTGYGADMLWRAVAIMAVMLLGSLVLQGVSSRVGARVHVDVKNEMQHVTYRHVLRAGWEALEPYRSGDLLNRLNSDVNVVSDGIIGFFPSLATSSVKFAGAFAIMLYYDPTMALIALLGVPVTLGLSRMMLRKLRAHNLKIKELTGEENGTKYWGGLMPNWTPNLGAIPTGEYLDDENLTRTKEFAQIQHRMYIEDASAPGIAEMTSGTFDIKAYFEAGNIYTMINGDWMFRLMEADFEWGAAPLPIFEGEPEGSSVGQSSYLVVSSTSKNPEAAYKFIEFYCTSPEGTSIIAENRDVPSYTTDEALEVYKSQVNVPGVDYRFSAKIKDEQKGEEGYASLIEAYRQEWELYLLDEQSLDDTFKNYAELRDEIMN